MSKELDPALAPGHTDLMVDPESLDAWLEANPLPPEPSMTAKQYKIAIERLGLSQVRTAELLGASGRSGQNWAANGPPEPVAIILRLMLAGKITADDVTAARTA